MAKPLINATIFKQFLLLLITVGLPSCIRLLERMGRTEEKKKEKKENEEKGTHSILMKPL